MELPVEKQRSEIKGILEVGLKEDDLVIAGALVEYSYKKEFWLLINILGDSFHNTRKIF